MRAAALVLVVAVAIGLSALLWLGGDSAAPSPLRGGDDGAGTSTAAAVGSDPGADVGVEREFDAPTPVATRAAAVADAAADLADSPTACLLVVDHARGTPIADAAIRRMQGGAVVGFSDRRGLAELPLKQREQLAIVADGYLLRMAPTRLGSTSAEPQRVQLVEDRWSATRRFEFVNDDGAGFDDVFVRFRPLAAESAPTPFGPSGGDATVQRAWSEHTMLAGNRVCRDVPVQLGAYDADRVHRLGHGSEVRFTVPGRFALEAATADGLTKSLEIQVDTPSGRSSPPTVRVVLSRGDFVLGRVLDGSSRPLRGATLTLQGGDPLGLLCTTGEDGAFAFGPLPAGQVTLLARHPDHEPLAFGPVSSKERQALITLRELPRSTVRGRVRRRPDLEPVAGATVSWSANRDAPITTVTAADGTFRLATTGDRAGRLLVSVPGCIAYEELVEPGAAFAEYDLLPSSTAERLDKKLTAVLAGIVLDAESRPAAGVSVRWTPAQRLERGGTPGRRVISGNSLLLPLRTTTREDGTFVIETNHFGMGTISLLGRGVADKGIPIEAAAGVTRDGLRLRLP